MRALAALTTILLLLSLLPGDTVRAAEPDYGSGEFHELNLYLYSDLDDGSGSFNTTAPASDSDTESDTEPIGARRRPPPPRIRPPPPRSGVEASVFIAFSRSNFF